LTKKFSLDAAVAARIAALEEENFKLRSGLGVPLTVKVEVRRVGYKARSRPREHIGRRHLVIPDCQVHDGVDTSHLPCVGRYMVEKQPDVVVCIGDFADMPSLCSYDRGKKQFEGRRYRTDVEAAVRAMAQLMAPLQEYNEAQRRAGKKPYRPRLVMTLGNHEHRIARAVEEDARLDGTISVADLQYEKFGWEVHPFLEVVEIDGVEYAHYFTTGAMGRPVTSAAALLRERAGSAVMGHVQHTDVAIHRKTQKVALFVGTCYLHDEAFLTPQGQGQRRQIVMLNEVEGGHFDPMFVSLRYLAKYA